MNSLLLVGFCWLLFGALHSFFIYLPVRNFTQELLGVDDQTYRLIYALLSLLSFFVSALVTLLSHGNWLLQPDFITYAGGSLLMLGGLYLIKLSFRNYSLTIFVGLQPETNTKLEFRGMNRFVRHPLYLSTILFLVGFMVFWPSDLFILTGFILIVYTIFGARLEERKLINQFGKEYTDYIKEVPFIFPKLRN
jgi:protein-S-isoprenylcysteine O-methyltransferase Ste14